MPSCDMPCESLATRTPRNSRYFFLPIASSCTPVPTRRAALSLVGRLCVRLDLAEYMSPVCHGLLRVLNVVALNVGRARNADDPKARKG